MCDFLEASLMTFHLYFHVTCYKSLSRMADGTFDLVHGELKALDSVKYHFYNSP